MMSLSKSTLFTCLLSMMLFCGCNKDKDTTIPLPYYPSELVVECYLEPGKPYKLLLTESVSYFEAPAMPEVSDAIVTISHKGKVDTLQYITFTFGNVDTTKLFNFTSPTKVLADYEPYILNVADKRGRKITGITTLLPPTPIDTLQFFSEPEDTLGYIISEIHDNPDMTNYFRYVLLSVSEEETYAIQSLYFDELLTSSNPALLKVNNNILIKSPNEFSKNPDRKTHHRLQLYHIEEAYYRFLKSVADARDANGNPFAQPPSIKSNVKGGKGIFTAISVTTKEIISPN